MTDIGEVQYHKIMLSRGIVLQMAEQLEDDPGANAIDIEMTRLVGVKFDYDYVNYTLMEYTSIEETD